MIQHTPSTKRFTAENDWLVSNFSFSFGPYYDPDNTNFGPLRVLNDDIIQPGKGFGIHPHREAEIVSIVLKGQLKHEDSLNNVGILQFGDIQRMTAGTGVLHSEFNPTSDEETHILQLWFMPNEKQLTPSYEDISFDPKKLTNQLLPIVSTNGGDHVARIHQDLTMYLSKVDAGKEIQFEQQVGRKIYLFVIEGSFTINEEVTLNERDDARITELHEITLQAKQDSFILLIDLPGGEE
ncbi:hypothetical protein SAMN05880501_105113 [Ureibacillus xyleni]|uniref:Pirin N-terminal domain-containing protein n=1 Tax=Ureibacillus xyleni TaxID=614648 RepID=A0A285SMD7_9BACL|nr:pirin family protein [Ureibacillus xyleni]SOC08611.1 hypothetical protein SAMN05880501_105113 [Ureibacillus xyleni]